MKLMHYLAVTVTALVFSGTAQNHAHAQSAPAYLVVEVDVHDQQGFQEYAEKATKTVEQHDGTFLVLAKEAETIEGSDPEGVIVIVKFDNIDDARGWLNSPEYTEVKEIRHRTAKTRQYLVEGVTE